METPVLGDLLMMDQQDFSKRFKGSPIKRTKRRGLLRNVAVAMGNSKDPRGIPALSKALTDDEPLIRQHAAWALGRIGGDLAGRVLRDALAVEQDRNVLDEMTQSLNEMTDTPRL